MKPEIIEEISRIKLTNSYKEAVGALEMESRFLRRRRMPYIEALSDFAKNRASLVVISEQSQTRMSLTLLETTELVHELAKQLTISCRDAP